MDRETSTTSNTTPESAIQEDTGRESDNSLSSINVKSSTLNNNATIFKDLDTKEYTRELKTSISSVSDNDTISSSEKYMIKDIMQDEQTDDDFEDASVCKNNKDLFAKESILNSFTQAVNKKIDDNDKSSDAFLDTEENLIKYIKDCMIDISEKTNRLEILKYNRILSLSKKKFAAHYLVEHNVLQEMLKAAYTKPNLVKIVFRTIIIVCRKHENLISIGKNLKFATSILTHLKSIQNSVLLYTLRFLKIAVRDIQRDHNSCWLSHLKTCEFFEHCVITIFKFQFNEKLIATATNLLREIARTPYHQSNLLKQLFNIQHNLIPVLMTSCMQMIISKNNKKMKDKKMDFKFVYKWLSIMTIIKTDLASVFRESKETDKYTFLRILFMMLHPYQEPDILSPRREINLIEQDVIFKCVSLLSYVHHDIITFYVPLRMDGILMKIILNLKTGIESEAMNPDSSRLEALLRIFLEVSKVWLYITEYRTCLHIAKSIKPFDQKDREYFLKLIGSDSHAQKRIKMINDNLKEIQNTTKMLNMWKESELCLIFREML